MIVTTTCQIFVPSQFENLFSFFLQGKVHLGAWDITVFPSKSTASPHIRVTFESIFHSREGKLNAKQSNVSQQALFKTEQIMNPSNILA